MKTLFVISFYIFFLTSYCQGVVSSFGSVKPETNDYENITVKKLSTDINSTTFAIWIKQSVKLHKHVNHVENVYITEGSGEFQLGDSIHQVKSGDLIVIPKNTWHGVKVNSTNPMKVISVQSPEFIGKDRVFKEGN